MEDRRRHRRLDRLEPDLRLGLVHPCLPIATDPIVDLCGARPSTATKPLARSLRRPVDNPGTTPTRSRVDNPATLGGRPAPERGNRPNKRGYAKPPHVAFARPNPPLHLVFLGLTLGDQRRTVCGSPDRTETPNSAPRRPSPPARSGPQDYPVAATARTMRQLRRSPHRQDGGESRWLEGMATAVPVMDEQDDSARPTGPRPPRPEPSPRRPVRRLLRRHGGRRQDPGPRPDLRAPLDPPGRPSLRRDHLGVPDRRHRQRIGQVASSSRRTSRSPTSGASSPPTSSSASTSAATSARPSARPRVRQLIDRVVNTITAWAETQHYFATDADLADLQGRADPPDRPPEDGVQLAGLVQRRHRAEAAVLAPASSTRSRTRCPRSWTWPRPRRCSSSSARAPAATSPPSAPPARRWPAAAPPRAPSRS